LYHGKIVTIIWDKTGEKFKRGKGLQVLVDGQKVAGSQRIERISGSMK
jgi:hypothetical protein